MRALVCVKRVVDYAVKVRVSSNKAGVEINNVKMSMNPFCEIAVEEGIKLKEAGVIKELVAVSIGADKSQEVVRQALAMGADRGILMTTKMRTDQELQPLAVAKLLRELVKKEEIDIVLCGKQAIDDDSNQTGQLLAGLLGWPQATSASSMKVTDKNIDIEREVDAGIQKQKITVPAVITADLRLNQPRYATLPNLMKAKKKPLEKVDAESCGVDLAPRYSVLEVTEPPKRKSGIRVASVDELLDKLRNDAKVIT